MPSQSPRSSGDPHHEYTQRRSDRQEQAARQSYRERLVGNARVVVFLLGLVAGYFALATPYLHPGWLAPFVLGFAALLFAHESVRRAWHRATRAVGFYDASLQRLGDDWRGKGQQGLEYQDEKHPYAADIDLFGSGSLFELLCTARTRTGEDTLAGWLSGPAAPDEIRARQAAVAELRDQLDLREELALLGSDLPIGVDFSGVAAWGRSPVLLKGWWPCFVALVLGVAAIVCLSGWLYALFSVPLPDEPLDFWQRVGALPFAVVLLLEGGFSALFFRSVQSVLASVERRGRDLAMLSAVLACLEKATFRSPRLVELHRDLTKGDHTGTPPSQRIAALGNLIDLLNSRKNQFFMLFALLLLWGTQMAHAIERWRSHSGPSIGRWLDIVGQFEALCALAAFAHANPANPFPEIVEAGPIYEAEGLGHPLRPGGPGVRNDLKLGEATRVLIVSGSNMSGKSTFLRTIGVNAVLALAGAPVLAHRMRISPLALGGTLHPGFAPGGPVALPGGDRARQADRGHLARADPAVVPARRNLVRDELTRPLYRGQGGDLRPGLARGDRPRDDARPHSHTHHREPGRHGEQRPLRRPVRRGHLAIRLPVARGRREEQQRPGPHAGGGARCVRGRFRANV